MKPTIVFLLPLCVVCLWFPAQARGAEKSVDSPSPFRTVCSPDNGEISLPKGFCDQVVADNLGSVRHIVVRENGDLYARLRDSEKGGSIVALRDSDDDGVMDREERLFDDGGTGIGIWRDNLYFSTSRHIYRQRLSPDRLKPVGEVETVVSGFPFQWQHDAKSFAINGGGDLFVNVGAPSNACQTFGRIVGLSGDDPCSELEEHAGIWRFSAFRSGQKMQGGEHFATGIRNAVAIAWNPFVNRLYVVQNGRDQLHQFWQEYYTEREGAELPAEEFFQVDRGDDFGWPYCYYDQIQGKKVLAPEYGGDGRKVGRCNKYSQPIAAFPGHWAPNGLLFYTAYHFPKRYQGGAFIAFHGSWNRSPLPQQGYKVVFVPFADGLPSGEAEDFATGFAGVDPVRKPCDASFRPMGLAQGPDGTLYIGETEKGRIWRVRYVGDVR